MRKHEAFLSKYKAISMEPPIKTETKVEVNWQEPDPSQIQLTEAQRRAYGRVILERGALSARLWLKGFQYGHSEGTIMAINAAKEMKRVIRMFDLSADEIRLQCGEISRENMVIILQVLSNLKEGVWTK